MLPKAVLALVLLWTVAVSVQAEPFVSGPQAGARVTGFFDISGYKCGGAEDGLAVGTRPRYY